MMEDRHISQKAQYRRERYAVDPDHRARVQTYQREYRRKRYADDPEFRAAVTATSIRWNMTHQSDNARKNAQERARYATDAEYREARKATHNRHRRERRQWLKDNDPVGYAAFLAKNTASARAWYAAKRAAKQNA